MHSGRAESGPWSPRVRDEGSLLNRCVFAGQPQYTVSMDNVKTVYYTPNLCTKDTAASLPASDDLILALNLGGQATVLSFQVAIADQLNSDQRGAFFFTCHLN